MPEKNKPFKLTPNSYPPRNSKTLSEIQSYLKAYDAAQLRFRNPFTGQAVNVTEFLNPMVRTKFIVPGVILMLFAFACNIYILKNLTAQSAILSYVTFMCANLGAALLLPTFIVITLNRINHARAKKKSHLACGVSGIVPTELPSLEKIKNELICQLAEDYSPVINGSTEIFGSLKKYITVDQITDIFNSIFAGDNFNPLPLIDDVEKFENGRNEFSKMLQNGLDYGSDIGVIEDPKFIQFISISFAVGFLKREYVNPNSEYRFSNLDMKELEKLHHDFCKKFLAYCTQEYGIDLTMQHVEDRIMKLVDQFIYGGKINIETVFQPA